MVALLGPTATGKTEAAIALALRVGGEVVTADSVQVYRGLDIGSAKPSVAERRGVPHHLIDLVDPGDTMTVGRYQDLARQVIRGIHSRGRLPIVTGGSGLYVRAALDEWEIPRVPPDPRRRAELEALAGECGTETLWEKLHRLHPGRAERLSRTDLPRIIRAFEVGEDTGRVRESPYRLLKIGLWRERAEIHERILERSRHLWEAGMVKEAQTLLNRRLSWRRPPLTALGYREAAWYLSGRVTWDEGVSLFLRNSRRFAKRQLTWWRKEPGILWIRADQAGRWLPGAVTEFLSGGEPQASVPEEVRAPLPI